MDENSDESAVENDPKLSAHGGDYPDTNELSSLGCPSTSGTQGKVNPGKRSAETLSVDSTEGPDRTPNAREQGIGVQQTLDAFAVGASRQAASVPQATDAISLVDIKEMLEDINKKLDAKAHTETVNKTLPEAATDVKIVRDAKGLADIVGSCFSFCTSEDGNGAVVRCDICHAMVNAPTSKHTSSKGTLATGIVFPKEKFDELMMGGNQTWYSFKDGMSNHAVVLWKGIVAQCITMHYRMLRRKRNVKAMT